MEEKSAVAEQPNILLTKSSLEQGVLVSPQQALDLSTEKVETIEGLFSPRTQEAEEKVSESLARSVGELRPVMAGENLTSDTRTSTIPERKISAGTASVKEHTVRARETVAYQARDLAQAAEASETVWENIEQENLPTPAVIKQSVVRNKKEKPTQKPLELASHSISQQVGDLKPETASQEKVEPHSVGRKEVTVAEKVSTVLGTPDTSEKSSPLEELNKFQTKSTSSKVLRESSRALERPQLRDVSLSFLPQTETSGELEPSLPASQTSLQTSTGSRLTNLLTAEPRTIGESQAVELSGQLEDQTLTISPVKSSACRTESLERAAALARVMGEEGPGQEVSQEIPGRPEVRTSSASCSRERSQSRETARWEARQEGSSAAREGAETLETLSFTDQRAEEVRTGENKGRSSLSTNILGFQPPTSQVDSLEENLPKEDRATVNKNDLNKNLVINNERHLGSIVLEEDLGDLEYLKPQEESSNIKNDDSRLESSQYQSKSMGYDIESLDSQELPVKTPQEQSLSKISKTSTLKRASSVVSHQGTSEIIETTSTIEPEEFRDQVARKLPRASSESSERVRCNPVRTGQGGRAETDTTRPLQTNLIGSAEASVKSETRRRDSVKRLSIVGGISSEEHVLEALEDKPVRTAKVSESVERKLSSERAASQVRLVGFVPQEEKTEEERTSLAAPQVSSTSSTAGEEKQKASYNIIQIGVSLVRSTGVSWY